MLRLQKDGYKFHGRPFGRGETKIMMMNYNKLWKLLIDEGINKTTLRKRAGISSSSMAKLGKGENVTTDVLCKICETLKCSIEDIAEVIPTSSPAKDKGVN